MIDTRVLILAPNILDNQSFWRAGYPLLYERSFLCDVPAQLDWINTAAVDVAFLQRPFQAKHTQILRYLHGMGIPCVIDFDDLLWDLPKGHPAQKAYQEEAIVSSIECIREADGIICSTPALAAFVTEKGGKNVHVVPNALPDYMRWTMPKCSKVVWWRGGRTHAHDTDEHEDAVIAAVRANPEWKLLYCGENRSKLDAQLGPQYEFQDLMPINHYHERMRDIGPAVMIGPLVDHPFNRCKSNIGWLEASYAGAVYVAPDFDEYAVPGCVRYGVGGLADTLSALLAEKNATRTERVNHSRSYIDANLRLSLVNPQRVAIVKALAAQVKNREPLRTRLAG